MQFKVGDKTVHKSFGVGIIQRIESREIGGLRQDFYIWQSVSSGDTMMIPTESKTIVMRELIDTREIKSVYSILRSPGRVAKTTWNRRFREFKEKLHTGSVRDVAEVLRDLNSLRTDKSLSDGEKDLMKKAKNFIISEIAAASSRDRDSVETELEGILIVH